MIGTRGWHTLYFLVLAFPIVRYLFVQDARAFPMGYQYAFSQEFSHAFRNGAWKMLFRPSTFPPFLLSAYLLCTYSVTSHKTFCLSYLCPVVRRLWGEY